MRCMSPQRTPVPDTPTLPQGQPIATYRTYSEAQRAVDYLSDQAFPVERVAIVGTDLRSVERVTGRLTYGKVAMAGLFSGAYFGLFVGLLLTMFGGNIGAIITGVVIGAGFGLLMTVVPYAMQRGKRDFTSASQIVATSYTLLCADDVAGRARQLLSSAGMAGTLGAAAFTASGAQPTSPVTAIPAAVPGAGAPVPPTTSAPSEPDRRFVDSDGRPKYGLRIEDLPPGTPLPDSVLRQQQAAAAAQEAAQGPRNHDDGGSGSGGANAQGSASDGDQPPSDPYAPPPTR